MYRHVLQITDRLEHTEDGFSSRNDTGFVLMVLCTFCKPLTFYPVLKDVLCLLIRQQMKFRFFLVMVNL